MAEAGVCPEEDFSAYSSAMMETARKVAESGELGEQICSALVLKNGRMLIMHEAVIGDQSIYLSILCSRVPAGMQNLIKEIVSCVAKTLLGNRYQEPIR